MLFRPDPQETFKLSPIKQIELAAAKIPGCISLAQGIPSFQTPEAIRNFIKEKIDLGLCDKYSLTTGLTELREEISLSLSSDGLKFDPDSEIIITAGSIEGITAAILSCTEPGDEVLVPSPTYASYLGAIKLARCTPRYVELDEENGFDFEIEKFERTITKSTKAILYCSPNNPTGTLFSEAKTRAMVEIAIKHGLFIIVDEVYKDFYYTSDSHFSATQIHHAREHLIRVCSFSKAFAMTGWRVGFLHGDKVNVKKILKFHDAMVTCAPVASQYGAIAALRMGDPYLQDFKKQYKERRDYTISVLDDLSHMLDYQVPKAAYFAFPRIKDTVPLARDSHKLAYDILEKAHVALVPGSAFGPTGESHLRITFGRDAHDLTEGLARFSEYLSGSRKTSRALYSTTLKKHPSVLNQVAKVATQTAAKLYITRNRPTIIGITGTTGKTVIKRLLLELLSKTFHTRANILSYNTEIGLPLSILNIKAPKDLSEKVYFPVRLIHKVFFSSDDAQLLILEYGINSAEDASLLLKIAKPDWLIISDVCGTDPSLELQKIQSGIKVLISSLPTNKIIWNCSDSWLNNQSTKLNMDLGIQSNTSCLSLDKETHIKRIEAGDSAKFGLIASAILASKLGVAQETISTFLGN